jgi:hypothetical protein
MRVGYGGAFGRIILFRVRRLILTSVVPEHGEWYMFDTPSDIVEDVYCFETQDDGQIYSRNFNILFNLSSTSVHRTASMSLSSDTLNHKGDNFSGIGVPMDGISSLSIGKVTQVSMPTSPSHAVHTHYFSFGAIVNIAVKQQRYSLSFGEWVYIRVRFNLKNKFMKRSTNPVAWPRRAWQLRSLLSELMRPRN